MTLRERGVGDRVTAINLNIITNPWFFKLMAINRNVSKTFTISFFLIISAKGTVIIYYGYENF